MIQIFLNTHLSAATNAFKPKLTLGLLLGYVAEWQGNFCFYTLGLLVHLACASIESGPAVESRDSVWHSFLTVAAKKGKSKWCLLIIHLSHL